MAKIKISTEALLRIVASYKSQQEQLTYQLMQTNAALAELEQNYSDQLKDNSAAPSAKKSIKSAEILPGKTTTNKRRGRPAKNAAAENGVSSSDVPAGSASSADPTKETHAPKKRGRKPGATTQKAKPVKVRASGSGIAKRGRKPAAAKTATTKPAALKQVKTKPAAAKSALISGKASTKSSSKASPTRAKSDTSNAPAKRRGRPRKSESSSIQHSIASTRSQKISGPKADSTSSPKTAPVRKRKRQKLSDWDQIMVTALQKSNTPLKKADLDQAFMRHSLVRKNRMTPELVYLKVARVIHKLANTRGLVQKVEAKGKGYAYKLPA